MKILYHHRVGSRDGQYVHIDSLTAALAERGHELVFVSPKVGDAQRFGGENRMVAALRSSLPKAAYESAEFAYAIHAYRRLARAARRHQPDVIYERYNLFLPSGVWVRNRYGIPLLLEVNAPLYSERARYGGLALARLARWSERYTWRRADHVLPVTRVLARLIAETGVPDQRMTVIPNGIEPALFRNVPSGDEAKRSMGLEGRTVVGFVGFMREWHRLERALELLLPDPNRHLLVVGDGPARADIVAQAHRLGVSDRVTVTGTVERKEVASCIAAFDVALQPHVVPYASPLKLLEYMAMGKAIVAPAMDNIGELLQDGSNAVLFDPDYPNDFVRAADLLCRDAGLRSRIGTQAARTIDERDLTWSANARRVEGIATALSGAPGWAEAKP